MKRGAAWEFQLKIWHDLYRRERLAFVEKTYPPITMKTDKNKRGEFTAAYSGRATCDFFGLINKGPGLLFDAKEAVNGLTLPLSRIEPHQRKDLESVYLMGHHAFIAARFLKKDVMCVFDWELLRGRYDGEETEGSVHADEGRRFGSVGWLELFVP